MAGTWKPGPRMRVLFIAYVVLMACLVMTSLALGEWRPALMSALAALPGCAVCIAALK